MIRCTQDGWIKVTKYDKARRRALWMRVTDKAVEFCAGREGDDAYVRIPRRRNSIKREELYNLQEVGRTAEWGIYEQDLMCSCPEDVEGCLDKLDDDIWEARHKVAELMKKVK